MIRKIAKPALKIADLAKYKIAAPTRRALRGVLPTSNVKTVSATPTHGVVKMPGIRFAQIWQTMNAPLNANVRPWKAAATISATIQKIAKPVLKTAETVLLSVKTGRPYALMERCAF